MDVGFAWKRVWEEDWEWQAPLLSMWCSDRASVELPICRQRRLFTGALQCSEPSPWSHRLSWHPVLEEAQGLEATPGPQGDRHRLSVA